MKKDLQITFITELAIIFIGILIYRVVATRLGEVGFAEYALSRRSISFLIPLFVVGLGVGIPRFIAISNAEDKQKSDSYFLGALFFVGVEVSFVLVFCFSFREFCSNIFFGNAEYARLVIPLAISVVGALVDGLCYSFFRGNTHMGKANILRFINMAIVPTIAISFGFSVESFLLITGLGLIVVSSVFLLLILFTLKPNLRLIYQCTADLLKYGVQRVPGDFGLSAILALPAIISAHYFGVKQGGGLAFSLSLLTMSGAIFGPIGLILLPKASSLISTGQMPKLRYYVIKTIKIQGLLTILGFLFVEIFAKQIISFYLGNGYLYIVPVLRVTFVACIGYCFYVCMRSVIDAYYVKSYNTLNILISLIFFVICLSILTLFEVKIILIQILFTLTILLLGTLTLYRILIIIKYEDK